ncbi:MAG TPA: DUF5063 domain-containing protein [Paludibacteraceae bacterium]|nr:DUF5063 domain-containing protein [Paludibacteraceae bacterium]HQB68709.1 DUF5063 domain-containing protein [Paludibacteraceae bacterium]HRS67260.1 DUF5063 domain-containing protein [Paludibacteraceae bacterium]
MSTFYTKDKLEFLTVAVETCKFLEHASELTKSDFVSKTTKLLPLLYLKTSMVQVSDDVFDDNVERFVTEVEYAHLRSQLADLLGESDDYLDSFDANMLFSDTTLAATVSEDLADVYQSLKDYVGNCQVGDEQVMNDALFVCISDFKNYWGARLLGALRALHVVSIDLASADNL